MKIEKLNHNKFKYLLYTLILGVVLIFIIIFQTSKASYRTTQSINVANGTINYKMPDLRVVAVYLQSGNDYVSSNDTVPTSGYVLNTTKTSCTKNGSTANVTITYDSGTVSFTGLSKGVKCYLYFDIDPSKSVSDIIANATTSCTNMSISGTGGTVSRAVSSGSQLCKIQDGMYTTGGTYGDGYTYVYRGAVNNNWVKFAGKYWRIIRINGDGSIRMIYSGTTAPDSSTATVMTGSGTQIATSAFNSSINDNMYEGWKYTSGNSHGSGTYSTIAQVLVGTTGNAGWYSSSGLSSYSSYLANGKFCNDRTTNTNYFTGYYGTGTGTTNTAYAPVTRIYATDWNWKSNQTFTSACTNSSDIFTGKVGLITLDDVLMGGGFGGGSNSGFYLYTGLNYWTMSPGAFASGGAGIIAVTQYGSLFNWNYGNYDMSIRPVINLKAGTKFTGSGTYDDVYEVAS